jgi:hypothetical protein
VTDVEATTDADAVADQLYRLPPDRFIEARNARAKEIAASGDRPTAAAVRKFPKPSVAAWLANVLVREHRDVIDDLLDLGRALRLAQEQASGQEMRTLSARRQERVHHLVALAADEARASGHTLGAQAQRQLEATLDAAVADESAAAELRSGRLTEPLRHVGFGDVASLQRGARERWVEGPPSTATGSGVRRAQGPSRGGDRPSARTLAEQALADARRTLESSDAVLDEARRKLDTASARRREAAEELREADRHLAQASASVQMAEESAARARGKVKDAERVFRRQATKGSEA